MQKSIRSGYVLVGLALVAAAIYLPLLRGEFIFDDLDAVWHNPQLAHTNTISKVFNFTLKPSRSISNVLLGVGEYLAPRSVTAQRAISILVHALASLFLLLNLFRLSPIFPKQLPKLVCIGIALLFSVCPIHAESVAIAQYRMDMLGTLFTLVAVYLIQIDSSPQPMEANPSPKTIRKILLFLCLGAASLSKEPYVVVAPLLCFLVACAHQNGRKTAMELMITQAFWGLLLLGKIRQAERHFAYSFSELLGYGNLTPMQHLHLAVEGFYEGIHKIVTGHNLTIVRLSERAGLLGPDRWPWGLAVWAAATSGLVLLLKRDNYWRIASGFFIVTGYLYLAIPNVNIGSEHYWYFGAAALWMLVLPAIWWAVSGRLNHYRTWFVVGTVCFAVAQVSVLERRIYTMRTRFDFYLSELKRRPGDANRWVDLAATLLDNPKENVWTLAGPMLDEARTIDPNNPLLALNDFYLASKYNSRSLAAGYYRQLLTMYQSRPEKIDLLRRYWHQKFGEEPGTHAVR